MISKDSPKKYDVSQGSVFRTLLSNIIYDELLKLNVKAVIIAKHLDEISNLLDIAFDLQLVKHKIDVVFIFCRYRISSQAYYRNKSHGEVLELLPTVEECLQHNI